MTNSTLLSMIVPAALAVGFLLVATWRRRRTRVYAPDGRVVAPDMHLGAVPTYRRTLPQLTNELARVRRYNRPLTLVVLRIESDQLLLNLKRDLVPETGNGGVSSYNNIMQTIQLVFSLVGSILSESLRESDIATYDVAYNQYVILLPESDIRQATQTVRRLKKLLFKRTAGHLVAGIASFPEDGLLIEDLVQNAVEKCVRQVEGRTPRRMQASSDG